MTNRNTQKRPMTRHQALHKRTPDLGNRSRPRGLPALDHRAETKNGTTLSCARARRCLCPGALTERVRRLQPLSAARILGQ
jgi:hypothetical protein